MKINKIKVGTSFASVRHTNSIIDKKTGKTDMYTYLISKLGTSLRTTSLLLLTCLAIGVTSPVSAVPLAPVGFGADTGAAYFTPNNEVLGFELFDLLEPFTSLGFFYESDSSTTISLFDSTDPSSAGAPQVAFIDFSIGAVFDVDDGVLESTFVTKAEDIGFFLTIDGNTIYSDPLLNGGLDLFSAFPSLTEDGNWAFIFEGVTQSGTAPINITLVNGLSLPVPEPSILALLALGVPFLLVSSHRRRKSL